MYNTVTERNENEKKFRCNKTNQVTNCVYILIYAYIDIQTNKNLHLTDLKYSEHYCV